MNLRKLAVQAVCLFARLLHRGLLRPQVPQQLLGLVAPTGGQRPGRLALRRLPGPVDPPFTAFRPRRGRDKRGRRRKLLNVGDLWPFFENPACPDSIWKPVTPDSRQRELARRESPCREIPGLPCCPGEISPLRNESRPGSSSQISRVSADWAHSRESLRER